MSPAIPENDLATAVIDCAFEIHRVLGPGLLESVYETILERRLTKLGYTVRRQAPISIVFDDLRLDGAFRADLAVNELLIVELKAVEALTKVHLRTVLTYLRLSGLRLAIVINFDEPYLKNGIKRVANVLPNSDQTLAEQIEETRQRLRGR